MKSRYRILLHSISVFVFLVSFSETKGQIDTAIVRTYGGPFFEEGRQIIQTLDGGYAVIGTTGSDQANNTDFYLLKLDADLNCQWSQHYGGAEVEWGYSLVEDDLGNLVLCGYTNSFGAGGYDVLVIKVDTFGEVLWQQTYGGSDWDFAYKIIRHPDYGYLLAGETWSYGHGMSDGYLLHIDGSGDLVNEWMYGGEGRDDLHDVAVHNDLIYAVGTSTLLSNLRQLYLLSLELNGSLNWYKLRYLGDGCEGTSIAVETNGVIVTGTWSNELFAENFYLIKFDHTGTELWNKFDALTAGFIRPSKVIITPTGLMICGQTNALGLGGAGYLLQKRSQSGNFQIGPTFGGIGDENGLDIFLDQENRLILLGSTDSYSGGFNTDIYLVMLPTYELVNDYMLDLSHEDCFMLNSELNQQESSGSMYYDQSTHQVFFSHESEFATLEIFDLAGKLCFTSEVKKELTIPIEILASGIYFLKASTEQFQISILKILLD